MALNYSPEFKDDSVQIVCVVEIQFESTWGLAIYLGNYLLCLIGPRCHTSEPSASEKKKKLLFPHVFLWFKPRTPGEDLFWTLWPLLEQTRFGTKFQAAEPTKPGPSWTPRPSFKQRW